MKRGFVVLIIIGLSGRAFGYEPAHRVFIYPKIGVCSNFSNLTSFMIGPSLVYRLSVLKGLGLSWEILYLVSSVDKSYQSGERKITESFEFHAFPIRTGLFYEIPYELTSGLSPYAEGGVGFFIAIIEGPYPPTRYNRRDAFITWEFYAGGGLMYRLKKGLISGGLRMGYAPLGGGSPVKANMSAFHLFVGYSYEF